MRKLTLKRNNAYVIYNSLRRTPPKDFADTDEMILTVDEILPPFEKEIQEFLAYRKKVDDLYIKQSTGVLTQEEIQEKLRDIQREVRQYELSEGETLIDFELDNSAFKKLSDQFEKWGKNWFADIENFIEVRKALTTVEKSK